MYLNNRPPAWLRCQASREVPARRSSSAAFGPGWASGARHGSGRAAGPAGRRLGLWGWGLPAGPPPCPLLLAGRLPAERSAAARGRRGLCRRARSREGRRSGRWEGGVPPSCAARRAAALVRVATGVPSELCSRSLSRNGTQIPVPTLWLCHTWWGRVSLVPAAGGEQAASVSHPAGPRPLTCFASLLKPCVAKMGGFMWLPVSIAWSTSFW